MFIMSTFGSYIIERGLYIVLFAIKGPPHHETMTSQNGPCYSKRKITSPTPPSMTTWKSNTAKRDTHHHPRDGLFLIPTSIHRSHSTVSVLYTSLFRRTQDSADTAEFRRAANSRMRGPRTHDSHFQTIALA